jgi:hypothetical protein
MRGDGIIAGKPAQATEILPFLRTKNRALASYNRSSASFWNNSFVLGFTQVSESLMQSSAWL